MAGNESGARCRWTVLAVVAGLVASLIATYPLVVHLGEAIPTRVPDDPRPADYLLSVWLLDEGGRRLYTDPAHLFEANAFHPMRHSLAYSESMLSAGAVVAPVSALTGNPLLAYNFYFIAVLALSFVGMFLLVREVTGDPLVGLLAGWIFVLVPDRLWFGNFLPSLSVHWVPFLMVAWMRFLEAPAWMRAAALAGALVVHMLSNAYHGVMAPALLVPWALVLVAAGPWPLRRWLASVVVLVPAALIAAALYVPYLIVGDEMQREPVGMYGIALHWYVGALADPGAWVRGALFGARRIANPRAAPAAPPDVFATSPVPVVLFGLAVLAMIVRRPCTPRPVGEGAHLAALFAFTLAAIAVSVGETLTIEALSWHAKSPFYYLHRLPGFGSMRVPRRFLMLAVLGGAAIGGIALAILRRRLRSRLAVACVAVVVALVVLLDSRVLRAPLPLSRYPTGDDIPPVYRWLATTPPDTAVLELPYASWTTEPLYMYFSLYHRRRIMNGFAGTLPVFPEALVGFPDALSLRALQDARVRYVIAHRDRLAAFGPMATGVIDRIAGHTELRQHWIGEALVTEIPPAPAAPAAPAGSELDWRDWRVTGSSAGAEAAADGDLDTHWTASVRAAASVLRIDLGAERTVTGIALRTAQHVLEYPRTYSVWASADGVEFRQVGGAPATLPPFASYGRDHRDVEVPLEMEITRARHFEIRVPWLRDLWMIPAAWGVHEIRVHALAYTDGGDVSPRSAGQPGR